MLQYNLSNTQLAMSDVYHPIPTEGELFAITVALLLMHDCAPSDLKLRALSLTDQNHEQVASFIEARLSPLMRDFERPESIHARLAEFVGMTISDSTNVFV